MGPLPAQDGRSLPPSVTGSGIPTVMLYGLPDCAVSIGLAEIWNGSGKLPKSVSRLRTPNRARP